LSPILASLLSAACAGPASTEPPPLVVPPGLEVAVLGGGCFWCLEAVYERVKGVVDVESGYAGGRTASPSYEQVGSGGTGHAEVVRITYDPREVTYDTLLDVFWAIHDPTTPDRQGADVGSQYRSIVLYRDEAQKSAVLASMDRARAAFGAPVVTEVVPLVAYWPAEAYHQDYFRNHPGQPYCAFVVSPKVQKFQAHFPELDR
jgi:peptide-methionine (S)-S-oxide reductase